MERHDRHHCRVRLLRAMLRYPGVWNDTVSLARASSLTVGQCRVELRALHREWRVLRCARGRRTGSTRSAS